MQILRHSQIAVTMDVYSQVKVTHFEGVNAALPNQHGSGVIGGRADLLVDASGDLNLAVGVTDRQILVEPFALPVGEVLVAGEKGAADLVQRVVFVPLGRSGSAILDCHADYFDETVLISVAGHRVPGRRAAFTD